MPSWLNKLYAGGWKLVFNEREKKDEQGQWRERDYRPPVWIKPITSSAAMYRWGFFVNWQERRGIMKWPYRQIQHGDSGQASQQENQTKQPNDESFYAGHFVDARTFGLALSKDDRTAGRKDDSLRHLGELFGAHTLDTGGSEQTRSLNQFEIDSAVKAAEATLSLYYAEMDEYRKHALNITPDHIYSGASLA